MDEKIWKKGVSKNAQKRTDEAYEDLNKRIKELLSNYQKEYGDRFELIRRKIEQTNGDWDISVRAFETHNIDSREFLQLLAFEYCLGANNITQGKVSFEQIAEKLFENVGRFRIGNPERGRDDKYLYSRDITDSKGIPITSKLYMLKHIGSSRTVCRSL